MYKPLHIQVSQMIMYNTYIYKIYIRCQQWREGWSGFALQGLTDIIAPQVTAHP